MSRIRDLHIGWMKDPAYRAEYDALEGEFALAAALIRARANAGLTQAQLAERMGTKQEVVARWEGGKVLPSTRTLARFAKRPGRGCKSTLRRFKRPAHCHGGKLEFRCQTSSSRHSNEEPSPSRRVCEDRDHRAVGTVRDGGRTRSRHYPRSAFGFPE